ncbi:MAG: hypothetical protein Q7J98_07600 [Kiritimatiellia bacterium]|nr:hypothetical protein [Kiritimatiellia bacterium]
MSNYNGRRTPEANLLRLTQWIIHAGMRVLLPSPCIDPYCICASAEDFLFLCEHCEKRIREDGFRDAVTQIKDSMNWLNQRVGAEKPSLDRNAHRPRPVSLRLASHYAAEIVSGGARPFEGKIVLMVLHFLGDLVPMVEVLNRLGARYEDMVLVAKPYPYPKRDQISHAMQVLGVNVHRTTDTMKVETCAHKALSQLVLDGSRSTKKIVVIEDGGYFAPLLHTPEFSSLITRCVGIVEQTAKGAKADREAIPTPQVCILSVAESKFKHRYEAPEIGRVTVQNIGRFVPDVKLSGADAVMFGFGSVGEHVAYHLNRAFNMGVYVVDSKSDLVLMVAQSRKDIVVQAKRLFKELALRQPIALVVGTTGEQSITRDILLELPDGCILVSTSSDQVEIDVQALREIADGKPEEIEEGVQKYTITSGGKRKQLTLLAEGYPINFYGSESLPNDTSDPILTLLILCAVELCGTRWKFENGIDVISVNKITDHYGLVKRILH